jgi:hypothetical protein
MPTCKLSQLDLIRDHESFTDKRVQLCANVVLAIKIQKHRALLRKPIKKLPISTKASPFCDASTWFIVVLENFSEVVSPHRLA